MAALLAVLVLGGIGSLALLVARGTPRTPRVEAMGADNTGLAVFEPLRSESGEFKESEATLPAEGKTVASQEPPTSPVPAERPIEDVLAESGEDPGAVYYMSRVREALTEGNPTFARELLRQFKTAHPTSVLIGEAEALFGTKGKP